MRNYQVYAQPLLRVSFANYGFKCRQRSMHQTTCPKYSAFFGQVEALGPHLHGLSLHDGRAPSSHTRPPWASAGIAAAFRGWR